MGNAKTDKLGLPSARPSPGNAAATDKKREVAAFLQHVAALPARPPARHRGRLIFALDATASRQPTWDEACRLHGEMFEATAALGGLDVQLMFYRGFAECKATRWLADAAALHNAMRVVTCVGGQTQIARVLGHAAAEARAQPVNALVFVGDAMEENVDELCCLAGQLGLLNVPVFIFHEGREPLAARCFRDIAKLTRGAYCPFDGSSAGQLRQLLGAVASFAAGGKDALMAFGRRTGGAALLLANGMGLGK